MAVKGFSFYLTYWDVGNEICDEERGAYYCAIMDYMFADIDREAELPFQARVAFKAVKANLKTSKNRSEAGQVGNDKRWNGKKKLRDSKSIAKSSQIIASSSSSSSSMAKPAQYKARGFAQPSASGAENAADDGSGWDWDGAFKELMA